MIEWSAVAGVCVIYLAGVVIPGPNFVAVSSRAVTARRAEALALVAGIVLVNLFWASSAILGVGAVFAWLPWLAVAVRVAGAGYLVWFGLRLIRSAGRVPAGAARPARREGLRRAFRSGVIVNIANPKSMAFYAAAFSSAAPPHVGMATFVAMLAVVVVIASAWYGMVAVVLSHPPVAAAFVRVKAAFDRVCGGAIILFGLRQAWSGHAR